MLRSVNNSRNNIFFAYSSSIKNSVECYILRKNEYEFVIYYLYVNLNCTTHYLLLEYFTAIQDIIISTKIECRL